MNMAKATRRRWLIVLSVALGAVLLAVGIYFAVYTTLIRQDNIRDKYTLTERDDSFLWSALKASLKGDTFDATEAQINTYLDTAFCGEDKFLKNVRVYFHAQEPCEIYARIHYNGQDLALSAWADMTFDSTEGVVGIQCRQVKLGEWPVPSWRVENILRDTADKYELMTFEEGILYVRTRYEYHFGDVSFHLRLEEFSPQEGFLRCRTNSLSRELLSALKDYLLSDDGQELFTRLFGERTNRLKNFVLRYFFRS